MPEDPNEKVGASWTKPRSSVGKTPNESSSKPRDRRSELFGVINHWPTWIAVMHRILARPSRRTRGSNKRSAYSTRENARSGLIFLATKSTLLAALPLASTDRVETRAARRGTK